MARSLKGKQYTWQLSDAPIGSGDAGEVFSVVCLEQPELTGMMKKPAKIATGGTIQRQAGQIAQESLALARLDGLPTGKAHPPRLLDEAPAFTRGTANYFIVSETAPGGNLADMLADYRMQDKPFPRRVIITVLDALFDLFSRAHRAGVLWNDVKLDHIYWHNATGGVSVIDWGNALFLDREGDGRQRTPPRWEDYQQMVDTLGGFLQRSAPELYADLGWDEFEGKALDSVQISVLARRIAYQQQVMALNVMEYQSLVRYELKENPSLIGLETIKQYQQRLEQIGAPWYQEQVLAYAESLIRAALSSNATQNAVRTLSTAFELFGEDLTLPWHLIREYTRMPEILTHRALESLVKNTFSENWSHALWSLILIAHESPSPGWWTKIMPVLRQQALGNPSPPPLQISQTLLTWVKSQGPELLKHAQTINTICQNWRTKGTNLEESPFDYEVFDLMETIPHLPPSVRRDLKISHAIGEDAIRTLFTVWHNAQWDTLPDALRKITTWDPDRWGILRVAGALNDFSGWLQALEEGPFGNERVDVFLPDLFNNKPDISTLLGTPPWLKSLLASLESILHGAPISNFRDDLNKWCPWLLPYKDLPSAVQPAPALDDDELEKVLSHFAQHMKTWVDPDTGLDLVREKAPQFYPYCKSLLTGFHQLFLLTLDHTEFEVLEQKPPHNALKPCAEALQIAYNWRTYVENTEIAKAFTVLKTLLTPDWQILKHMEQHTSYWQTTIQPALKAFGQLMPYQVLGIHNHNSEAITLIASSITEIRQTWQKIDQTGFHSQIFEELDTTSSLIRNTFLEWRTSYEHSDDRVAHLLYHSQLEEIRLVANVFLRLAEHSRQAKLSFAKLENASEQPFDLQIRTMQTLLNHLSVIEGQLLPQADDHRISEWQAALENILATESTKARQERVLSLSDNHPLYRWLLQAVFEPPLSY